MLLGAYIFKLLIGEHKLGKIQINTVLTVHCRNTLIRIELHYKVSLTGNKPKNPLSLFGFQLRLYAVYL